MSDAPTLEDAMAVLEDEQAAHANTLSLWMDARTALAAKNEKIARLEKENAALQEALTGARLYVEQNRKFMGDNYGYACMGIVHADGQIRRINAALEMSGGVTPPMSSQTGSHIPNCTCFRCRGRRRGREY